MAGGGPLPRLIAEKNPDLFVVALKGVTDPDWVVKYPHAWIRLGQYGKLIELFKTNRITQLVFAGHVKRPSWAKALTQLRPDAQGWKVLWQLRKRRVGDDGLLKIFAALFAAEGVEIIGADQILPDILTPGGYLSQEKPLAEDVQDIRQGALLLRAWGKLDQGQAIVVQNGLILGVEAIEGTDELIRRCGTYKRKGRGPVLIKMKKPQQDRRLDLPTIGENTIRVAIDAGFSGIAIEAGESLFLQPTASMELANQAKIFVWGFDAASVLV